MVQLYRVYLALATVISLTAAAEPCHEEEYAEAHYGECCANGGYKKEGRTEICKIVRGKRAKDPCLAEDYAEANYGDCCASGGYKVDGRGEICKIEGPRFKAKQEEGKEL